MIEHSSTPENLHSLLMMMREWAYRCHLEISLGNESYARLEIVVWIGEPSEMGLRCHLERSMLGSEPYARLCRCFWKKYGDGLRMPSGGSRTLDFVSVFE